MKAAAIKNQWAIYAKERNTNDSNFVILLEQHMDNYVKSDQLDTDILDSCEKFINKLCQQLQDLASPSPVTKEVIRPSQSEQPSSDGILDSLGNVVTMFRQKFGF